MTIIQGQLKARLLGTSAILRGAVWGPLLLGAGSATPPPSYTPVVPEVVSPDPAWTGVAGSGFTTTPSDPVRSTAKPAARLLTPPAQYFSGSHVIGVAAAANNLGTLTDGIAYVRFHFEGGTVDVTTPGFYEFTDARGAESSYWGFWAELEKPSGTAGAAHVYVEVVPTNVVMQSRVLGPYTYHPVDTVHDAEYTINPDVPVSATNLHTFDAAVAQIKADLVQNPRVTFQKAMSDVEMNSAGADYTPDGYITVEADFPVTFGRASFPANTASYDADSILRPRIDGLWFKGPNITFDYARVDTMFVEGGKDFVLEGVNMTNSRGAGSLWRGGPYFTGIRVGGNPYFLEVVASNLENVANSASLVRGGNFSSLSRDIFADALCITGNTVAGHDDTPLNDDNPAFDIVYTGSEGTATVARSGGGDPSSATYTFKWGANSATFTVGKLASALEGTGVDGYWFSDVVDYVNNTLAGLDAGWSATLTEAAPRRASSGTLSGLKAQGFGDTDCHTTALGVLSSFDAHGDWYQQRFDIVSENVIVYNNVAYDMQTQNIFLSSNIDCRDYVFFNNALGNRKTLTDYFDENVVSSQLGRSTNTTALSHVVLAHNSMPNQKLSFRSETASPSTYDSYCLISNNVFIGIYEAVSGGTINAVVKNNHCHAGEGTIDAAVGTTFGGSRDTLFPSFGTGDFTPAGSLLVNLKPPTVSDSPEGYDRGASSVLGSVYAVAPLAAPAASYGTIVGDPTDGSVLSLDTYATGSPTPTISGYVWKKGGSPIAGQTGATITLDEAAMSLSRDDAITCDVTYTNSEGATVVTTTAVLYDDGVVDYYDLLTETGTAGYAQKLPVANLRAVRQTSSLFGRFEVTGLEVGDYLIEVDEVVDYDGAVGGVTIHRLRVADNFSQLVMLTSGTTGYSAVHTISSGTLRILGVGDGQGARFNGFRMTKV